MFTLKFARLHIAAIGVMLLVGGCSSGPKDQDLATTIKGQMFSNAALRAANLDVSVKDGEATLSGDVPDDTARYQAFKLASDTPGVKHVVDKMTVQSAVGASPSPQPAASAAAPPSAEHKTAPLTKREKEKERREEREARRNKQAQNRHVEEAKDIPPPSPPVQPDPPPAPQPDPAPAAPQPPPPSQPVHAEIPAGTPVRIQMIDSIDSSKNHVGDIFHASLQSPLLVDGRIVVPAGVDMYVRLVTVESAGHIAGQSQLALELARMEYQGKEYPLASNPYEQKAVSRSTRSKETIGGGAVVGAVLGGIFGGGKGAVIGGAAGAGAGTAAQEATKAKQVQIASETKLDFSLRQPLELNYFPDRIPAANR